MDQTSSNIIIDGVAAVAELVAAEQGSDALTEARQRWTEFAGRLAEAPDDVPLAALCRRFRLDPFEIQCVVLALASHVEPRMAALVQHVGRQIFSRSVTVRLAIERFAETPQARIDSRKTFLPSGTLIRHRLLTLGRIEAGGSEGLLGRKIELTTPTVRFLLGESELSETVDKVAELQMPSVSLLNVILPPTQLRQAQELVEHHRDYRRLIGEWGFDRVLPYGRGLTMLFSGPSGTGKTLLAQALAAQAGRPVLNLAASDLPEGEGLESLLRDLFSEASMRDAVVLIDECEALLGKGDKRKATAFRSIEDFDGILILTTNHPEQLDDALGRRIIFTLPFEMPDAELRRQIWEVHLPPEVPLDADIDLEGLANRYDFTGGTIKNAILVAINRALATVVRGEKPRLTAALLEAGCRSQLRYALEELTVRTSTHLRLSDIVLPPDSRKKISELIAAIRNQSIVMNEWGFGKRLVTGRGITALFDGPPGTGKTLCAEIVAGEFDRPIYRVNIPEVVSKWVGETEKNIRAIFQQARISHAMLLFDEADSLFTQRSAETNSATDRYANMEVNLLLQEVERFPGVCILTTNFWGSLDKALLRRIQFRVTFEAPEADQRSAIWQVLCPPEAPLGPDVDWDVLAKLYDLTGGQIKNAILRAAYWAADGEGVITMKVLSDACIDEYKAAGKVARDPSKVKKRVRRPEDFVEAKGDPSTPKEGKPEGKPTS